MLADRHRQPRPQQKGWPVVADRIATRWLLLASGADAAPYFRVFNPVLQGEKFDSAGIYIRRLVPELEKLDNKYIHRPWSADPALLADAGIRLGTDYPEPLVDLQVSRKEALAAWERIRQRHA